jgi:hypothetical protein
MENLDVQTRCRRRMRPKHDLRIIDAPQAQDLPENEVL